MEATQNSEIQRIVEEDFQFLKNLGEGTYGQVVMARERATGNTVALKLVKKERTKREDFLNELCVSIHLSSYGGIIATHSTFMDSGDYYVLTQELAPAGSLHSIIQPSVGIPEEMVKRCAVQLTRALEYMHSNALVHRDLKPDNVLLMDKECHHVKLSDFGLTQLTGSLVPSMTPIIPYMSPELCSLKCNEFLALDPSVDVWALGVLLYVIFTGCYPWKRAIDEDPLFQEFSYWQSVTQHIPPPTCWQKFSRKAQDLFHVLLSLDPTIRNPVGVVLNHLDFPWGVEEITQENIESVVEGDDETRDDQSEVIIIEGEDEFIVLENCGDIEYIILYHTTEDSFTSSSNPTLVLFTDHSSLNLGSEIEIT